MAVMTMIDSVRTTLEPDRLIIGGHSMGGRTASMLEAEGKTSDGLLLFGYPLHPAGQPEKLRDAHLPAIRVPVLQFNGTEDALCTPELMERALEPVDREAWTLHWIRGADHSYAVAKSSGRTRGEVEAEILAALKNWLG